MTLGYDRNSGCGICLKARLTLVAVVLHAPRFQTLAGPAVFLAGPVKGAFDWRDEAIVHLRSKAVDLNICTPQRDGGVHKFSEEDYQQQVEWEGRYLRRCAAEGCVLFWLPAEQQNGPPAAGCYAQTTRFELGEWLARSRTDRVALAIGAEEGYSGYRYLRSRLEQDFPEIELCHTLAETCQRAIDLLAPWLAEHDRPR